MPFYKTNKQFGGFWNANTSISQSTRANVSYENPRIYLDNIKSLTANTYTTTINETAKKQQGQKNYSRK